MISWLALRRLAAAARLISTSSSTGKPFTGRSTVFIYGTISGPFRMSSGPTHFLLMSGDPRKMSGKVRLPMIPPPEPVRNWPIDEKRFADYRSSRKISPGARIQAVDRIVAHHHVMAFQDQYPLGLVLK